MIEMSLCDAHQYSTGQEREGRTYSRRLCQDVPVAQVSVVCQREDESTYIKSLSNSVLKFNFLKSGSSEYCVP